MNYSLKNFLSGVEGIYAPIYLPTYVCHCRIGTSIITRIPL